MSPKGLFSRNHKKMRFGETPFHILSDFLIDINNKNKANMHKLSNYGVFFQDRRLVECVFLTCEELKLDLLTGYQAIEILEKFMTKHLEDLFCCDCTPCSAGGGKGNCEDAVYIKLSKNFYLLVFSCIQLASKLTMHCNVIDNNIAIKFLLSMGHFYSKKALLESELFVLKTLDFCISVLNPLTYVEILLDVLVYNATSIPITHLYFLCQQVLQFTYLQRSCIYNSLLMATTKSPNPSGEQREKFMSVREDYMLLSVGVISVSAFILSCNTWEQVVEELSHITGISAQSIKDFAHITLSHIVENINFS